MKRLIKILFKLAFMVVIATSFAACSNDDSTEEKKLKLPTLNELQEWYNKPYSDVINILKKKGYVVVNSTDDGYGTDFICYRYYTNEGYVNFRKGDSWIRVDFDMPESKIQNFLSNKFEEEGAMNRNMALKNIYGWDENDEYFTFSTRQEASRFFNSKLSSYGVEIHFAYENFSVAMWKNARCCGGYEIEYSDISKSSEHKRVKPFIKK